MSNSTISGTPAAELTSELSHRVRNISVQSAAFFAGTIFTAVCGYLFRVYLARKLGAEGLGLYGLGMTLVAFFGVFNGLGLPYTAARFVAVYSGTGKLRELGALLGRGLALLVGANVMLGTVLLFGGRWVAVHIYHTSVLGGYLWAFAAIMLLGALSGFLSQVLAGYGKIAHRTAICNFIGSPLTITLAWVLLALGFGLSGYLLAQVVSALVIVVWLLFSSWRFTPKEARPGFGSFPRLQREVLSFSSAMFAMDVLAFVMTQSDKVAIGYYLSVRDIGIYTVAGSLIAVVSVVLQSVNQVLSPMVADLYARGQIELLNRLFQIISKWVMAFTVPLAAVLIIFAQPVMRIFGPDFEAGWPILVLGTVGQLVNCSVGSVGYLLLMTGRQHSLLRIQVAMAGLMACLTMLLVPHWGILGAAGAAAATNALTNLWSLAEVKRKLGLSPYNRSYLRLALPLAASVAAPWLLHLKVILYGADWVMVLVSLIVAYVVFFISALLAGIDGEEREIVRSVGRLVRARAWQAWHSVSNLTEEPSVQLLPEVASQNQQ
jgi:O-antigen/teichoic acid export membrane protein